MALLQLSRQDGSPYRPVHEQFRSGSYKWWTNPADEDILNLVRNLIAARVDYAVVTKWEGVEWLREQAAFVNSHSVQAIYDDGYTAIWKLVTGDGQSHR